MERDFDWWWTAPGEWVEAPNERRNGWSGMMRVRADDRLYYVKRQRNHMCRTVRHPLGWPTASREWQNLHRVRELGLGAPVPVFHATRATPKGLEAVLVTEELIGYRDLAQFSDLEPEASHRLAQAVGNMLGVLHRHRLQHSSLYDKHIMLRPEGGGFLPALIDLEKMRVRLTRRGAAAHDLEQLQRRQKVFNDADWEALRAAHAASFSAA